MTTDYNEGQIAEQYKQAKEQPWRYRVEAYSFMKSIGDLKGKKVVDVACGSGHFTRKLKNAGADKVVGFDISDRMVELAREQEEKDPLGIEYRIEDARSIVAQQDFDLAVSAWILVYAHDRKELGTMCKAFAKWLRPGGRFVTYTTNPDLYAFKPPADFTKYGFTIDVKEEATEGAPILWNIFLDDSNLEIENYYLPVSAYEEAFRNAGFGDFKIHLPDLEPNPTGEDDSEYWADFLKYPPAIVIDCIKQ